MSCKLKPWSICLYAYVLSHFSLSKMVVPLAKLLLYETFKF